MADTEERAVFALQSAQKGYWLSCVPSLLTMLAYMEDYNTVESVHDYARNAELEAGAMR